MKLSVKWAPVHVLGKIFQLFPIEPQAKQKQSFNITHLIYMQTKMTECKLPEICEFHMFGQRVQSHYIYIYIHVHDMPIKTPCYTTKYSLFVGQFFLCDDNKVQFLFLWIHHVYWFCALMYSNCLIVKSQFKKKNHGYRFFRLNWLNIFLVEKNTSIR